MFKPELWQSRDEYRALINFYGRRLSRNPKKYAFQSYDKERQKLLGLNLDGTVEYIPVFYSAFELSVVLPKIRPRFFVPLSFLLYFLTGLPLKPV